MAAAAVERSGAAVDHDGANRCGGNPRSVRQTVAALAHGAIVGERAGAWNVAGVFPDRGDGAGDAGAYGHLLGGAAAGKAPEPRLAGSGGGNPVVVAGKRPVRILCAARAVERGVWRFGGGNRTVGVDSDLGGNCVFGRRVECGGGGKPESVIRDL